MLELNFKLCCYNSFLWPGVNKKWSKQRFHWHMVSHASERHEGANGGKTWAETLRKGELWWKTDNAQLFKSFEFENGSRMSEKNLVILEFKACLLFFISFLFFHQMIALQKLGKILYILEIFKYLYFFPSFSHFPDTKGQMKWNNLWCHELACIKLQS